MFLYKFTGNQSMKYTLPHPRVPASREPAGKLWQLCKVVYVFEHKTQYLLIHAPITCIVLFWQIGNVPPMIS